MLCFGCQPQRLGDAKVAGGRVSEAIDRDAVGGTARLLVHRGDEDAVLAGLFRDERHDIVATLPHVKRAK